MSDKDELDLTDTFVSFSELTGTLDQRENAAQTRREAVAREDKEQNPLGDTTGIKIYPYVTTNVSWKQRVFSWFRTD